MKRRTISSAITVIILVFFAHSNVIGKTESFDTIFQKAENGDADAQCELGNLFLEGAVVPKDKKKAIEWFRKSAEQNYAKSQYHLGLIYLQNKFELEYKLAIELGNSCERNAYSEKLKKMREDSLKWLRLAYPTIKRLAESGDPEAQFILSRMSMGMLPDIKDKDKVAEWRGRAIENFKKIAESGDVKAERSLGEIYAFDSLNNPEMIKWYTKGGSQGDAVAQYELGSHYEFIKEYAKAIEWLTKAAKQGHIEAQYELGKIYNRMKWAASAGNEITAYHNDVKAVKWLEKAAQKGHADAQYSLAFCYRSMEEVQDYNEAIKWYSKAAEQGHIDAQEVLANMYYLGEEVEKDYEKALNWYIKKAEQPMVIGADLSLTQRSIASIYYDINKDYAKAFDWYLKMAKRGESDAQYMLGKMYYEGLGTEKNLDKSVMWYMKSAESGHASAQFGLAEMYFKGEGVIQDYVEAYKWANVAAMRIERYRSFRDTVKKNMTPEQIAEGQKKAREIYDRQKESDGRKVKRIIGE